MKSGKLTGTFSTKKRQKCKIVESEMGYGIEFALELLLVRILVLNHSKIIKYVLYFKTVSLKTCIPCVHCCLATEKYGLNK